MKIKEASDLVNQACNVLENIAAGRPDKKPKPEMIKKRLKRAAICCLFIIIKKGWQY